MTGQRDRRRANRLLGVFAALVACSEGPALTIIPEDPPQGPSGYVTPPSTTLPALVPALDINPDPDIVEVELRVTHDVVEFIPGVETEVLTYRDGSRPSQPGTIPGPLIEANLGDRLIVHLLNELELEATTLHFHGLRLPNDMDGNPMVSGATFPGESFTTDFEIVDTGLYWYHPHINTETQMARGLKGPVIVHDPGAPTADETRTIVLDAVPLEPDGSLRVEPTFDDIVFGRRGELLVNGAPRPSLIVASGARELWRVVNASNGRFFDLEIDGAALTVVGGDAGPVETALAVDSVTIAPGERVHVLVDFTAAPGSRTALHTREVARGHGGVDSEAVLMDLYVGAAIESSTPEPDAFTRPVTRLSTDGATLRSFELAGDLDDPVSPFFTVNSEIWPFGEPVLAQQGATERWEFINTSDGEHPFHLHGVFFQVIGRDGVGVIPNGWKDTVAIGPMETVTLAIKHEAVGRWMFHCQIPEHTDRGMAGDLIVEAGDEP